MEKMFRIKNALFLVLLSGLFLFSCGENKDKPLENTVKTEELDKETEKKPEKMSKKLDSGSEYKFKVSGALQGEKRGTPSAVISSDNSGEKVKKRGLSQMKFSLDENRESSHDHHLLMYFNNNSYKTSPPGLPYNDVNDPDEWVGKYPIFNDRNRFSDTDPSFSFTYFDRQPNKPERIFGGKAKTEGEFIILDSNKDGFSGTFEFEAFQEGGDPNSSISVIGEWKIKF